MSEATNFGSFIISVYIFLLSGEQLKVCYHKHRRRVCLTSFFLFAGLNCQFTDVI
uniref:Uncharacterized protein n=1 Tax=Anguilla anguilla TaxID=7936 RepID=A0A0E9QRR8_ANGAN